MPLDRKVTLQINLAPGDYLHARYILPHQLRILSPQVNEIILIVDSKPGKGRFSVNWTTYEDQFNEFLLKEIMPQFNVRIVKVDYGKAAMQRIAQYFFGQDTIPEKDFRGGPFYVYFFGLFAATHDLVFHLDSDLFLGGGSPDWIKQAIRLFEKLDTCLIVSPLPGPPHPDQILVGQTVLQKIAAFTFELAGMSTRIFMIDKTRFKKNKLLMKKPGIRNQVNAIVEGNPNADLPEHILSEYLVKHQLKRIDFLGSRPGLWSLHPPYRTKTFYEGLQKIIAGIEHGPLPAGQNGFYDIIDEVCDWSEARENLKNNRWWKRI